MQCLRWGEDAEEEGWPDMTKGHVLARAPNVSSPSIDIWTISSVVTNLICIFYVSHLVILLIVMYMPYVSRSLYIEPFSLNKFSLVLYYFTIFVRLL